MKLSEKIIYSNLRLEIPIEFRHHDDNRIREVVNLLDRYNSELSTNTKHAFEDLHDAVVILIRMFKDKIIQLDIQKIDSQKELAIKDYKLKSYKEFIDAIKQVDDEVKDDVEQTKRKTSRKKSSSSHNDNLSGLSRGERELLKKFSK